MHAITMTSYPYVYANEWIDDCLDRIKDYSEDSIPVLDPDNKLIGVVTSQDVMELADDEFGEDHAKLAGLSAEEQNIGDKGRKKGFRHIQNDGKPFFITLLKK